MSWSKYLTLIAFVPSIAIAGQCAILDSSNNVVNVIQCDVTDPNYAPAFPGSVPLIPPGGMGSVYNPTTQTFSAPIPPTVTEEWISAEKLLMRFTQTERLAIEASTDAGVADFLFILKNTPNVNLKDPETIGGVQYLESKGLIASGRSVQILQ